MLFECVGGKKQVKPTKKVGIKMGRRYPSAPAIVHMITGLCCKTFLGERDLDICANPSAVLCQFATCNTVLDTRTDVRADACERVGEKIFHAHFSWQEKKSTFSHKHINVLHKKYQKGPQTGIKKRSNTNRGRMNTGTCCERDVLRFVMFLALYCATLRREGWGRTGRLT